MLDEKPLDFDFTYEKPEEVKLMQSILNEYNTSFGLTCTYYRMVNDHDDVDKIFMEIRDKKYGVPRKVKIVMQYLEESIEMMRYGMELTDILKLYIEKEYFLKRIKQVEPQVGDLIYLDYAKIMFEIVNVIDAEANFFGNKLMWELTARIYRYNEEDKEIFYKLHQNEEIAINDDVTEESDEIFTYSTKDRPFGNY